MQEDPAASGVFANHVQYQHMIVGIDEVGRGPWAGPLVVGAVIIGDAEIEGLTDSKKLSASKRRLLDKEIRTKASAYGLGWVHAAELDEVGLPEALRLACRRALEQITVPYHEIIIDGTVNLLEGTGKAPYVTTMKKADLLISSVSAASIIAKVARDTWMTEQDAAYEGYGFSSHVGYGTAAHKMALERLGVSPLHRRSFAPIAAFLSEERIPDIRTESAQITSKAIGNAAETEAVVYLQKAGFVIHERNWKTKRCEIDIVAEKDGVLSFVEVKHRRNDRQGGGMAAVTSAKLRQMRFAAGLYMQRYGAGRCAQLAVIASTGAKPKVESFTIIE